ncbi:Uncharacterized protein OS=Sorangium cellulosum (strain So ce56) GN=sce5710 PE=4 SV=1 [Gemmata massiliana]|uniref:SMI1/KNR4 family protein n=1 Tax=Gemmata massiliana TaxID=1210884 RepID=A0A6P2D5A3_9BACT|nr:hypothetical protein [Gemmata massiliana]VTR96243.1 Uncharacterized protein OS=Sorangium cellulosum (strain So ce56) GN=sce5710 PE=4 SV=1 [Gemmata massiliana]
MTETQWLTCTDIHSMVDFVSRVRCRIQPPTAAHPYRDRPLRLFVVGCFRAHWDVFLDPDARVAVETAERFADGLVTRDALHQVESRARDLKDRIIEECLRKGRSDFGPNVGTRMGSLSVAAEACAPPRTEAQEQLPTRGARAKRSLWWWYSVESAHTINETIDGTSATLYSDPQQAALLRDIFGNPFRPIEFSPAWRTSAATALAAQMYESRDFSAMPILADALQDAGCDSADVLGHCRGPGPHARGCWVVDLVLGKE